MRSKRLTARAISSLPFRAGAAGEVHFTRLSSDETSRVEGGYLSARRWLIRIWTTWSGRAIEGGREGRREGGSKCLATHP